MYWRDLSLIIHCVDWTMYVHLQQVQLSIIVCLYNSSVTRVQILIVGRGYCSSQFVCYHYIIFVHIGTWYHYSWIIDTALCWSLRIQTSKQFSTILLRRSWTLTNLIFRKSPYCMRHVWKHAEIVECSFIIKAFWNVIVHNKYFWEWLHNVI